MEFYSAVKKVKLNASQKHKYVISRNDLISMNTHSMIPVMQNSRKAKNLVIESRSVVAWPQVSGEETNQKEHKDT